MADAMPKAIRIVIGTLLMAAFVLVLGAVLTRFAGQWGVPFFSFRSERGSACTNGLAGYTCSPVTAADVGFYGDVALPVDTRLVRSRYHATHDYQLDAELLVPPASASAALAALADSFGPCRPGHPSPMATTGLTDVCVMASDDASELRSSDVTSRLYVVGTGLRADGTRVVSLSVRSR